MSSSFGLSACLCVPLYRTSRRLPGETLAEAAAPQSWCLSSGVDERMDEVIVLDDENPRDGNEGRAVGGVDGVRVTLPPAIAAMQERLAAVASGSGGASGSRRRLTDSDDEIRVVEDVSRNTPQKTGKRRRRDARSQSDDASDVVVVSGSPDVSCVAVVNRPGAADVPKRRTTRSSGYEHAAEDVRVLSVQEVVANEVRSINNKLEKDERSDKRSALTCPICLGDVKDAMATSCGHMFCGGCIKKSLKVRARVRAQYHSIAPLAGPLHFCLSFVSAERLTTERNSHPRVDFGCLYKFFRSCRWGRRYVRCAENQPKKSSYGNSSFPTHSRGWRPSSKSSASIPRDDCILFPRSLRCIKWFMKVLGSQLAL